MVPASADEEAAQAHLVVVPAPERPSHHTRWNSAGCHGDAPAARLPNLPHRVLGEGRGAAKLGLLSRNVTLASKHRYYYLKVRLR